MSYHQVLQVIPKGVDVVFQDSDFVVSPMFVKALCMSVVCMQEQEHVKRNGSRSKEVLSE